MFSNRRRCSKESYNAQIKRRTRNLPHDMYSRSNEKRHTQTSSRKPAFRTLRNSQTNTNNEKKISLAKNDD